MPDESADSVVMLKAGATSSLAYGDGCIQLHIQNQEAQLSKLLELVQWSQPDVVLIEGFKGAGHPKVVLLREENDWEELSKLTGIACVIAQTQIKLSNHFLINRQDVKATRKWLQKWMDGDRDEDV
ncbi:molybdopterin-guanine dinucleotide biosynthesis protein B [compost metagenome]